MEMLSFYVTVCTDRRTDIKTDRRSPVKQYTPDRSMRGHKKKSEYLVTESFPAIPRWLIFVGTSFRYTNFLPIDKNCRLIQIQTN